MYKAAKTTAQQTTNTIMTMVRFVIGILLMTKTML